MSEEHCPSGRQWWSGNHWPSRHRTAFDVGMARVTVHVSYGDAQVSLVIRNTPPVTAADLSGLAGTGSGLGIANLRQRVELVHGTLRAGSAPGGGFCLEATLPAYVPTAEPVG